MGTAFHIENFGCRAARADGEAVSDRLRAAGLEEGHLSASEVVVVNTCSVTAEADRAARAFIRRTHRLNPEARILVTGCYAQRAPEELAGIAGVTAVVGNSHKALAPEIAVSLARGAQSTLTADSSLVTVGSLLAAGTAALIWADDSFAHSFLEEAQLVPGAQTRPSLKIQEGCSNRCTFCVIPQTRGGSRSLFPEKVLTQVRGFVASGGNELVFSGINLGRWGRDLPREPRAWTLPMLVREVIEHTELPLLRLSSIEPMDWDAELIELMRAYGGTRLARHAHLPLQSGSDAVLRRMHRRYRPWHYAEKAAALLEAAGDALTLGADVMAGFPGESEREFQETCDFLRSLPFGYLHLFPFSPRPGTRGWQLHAECGVPASVVEERMAELRRMAAEKTAAHRRKLMGRTLPAITLQAKNSSQATPAMTENFIPVEIRGCLPANLPVRVRLTDMGADLGMAGELEPAS